MKDLLTDLLEYMEQRADADIEGPNKEMGFQIRIEEALAKMDKADKVIQTCKSCGSFVFTADGTQCASCATPVEQPDLPAPNTVMWWLCRIADDGVRRKAVVNAIEWDYKGIIEDFRDAMWAAFLWQNTEEGYEFWDKVDQEQAPLLSEPDFTEYLELRK